MRGGGHQDCTILFCEQDVYIESDEPRSGEVGLGVREGVATAVPPLAMMLFRMLSSGVTASAGPKPEWR